VPIAGSYEFYHALKALGVETEMVVYPREDHSIQERAHQIDLQNRMLAWYAKYLK
jgi:dipeptidyl aminopeptidase/acylaminoacyl peptidase